MMKLFVCLPALALVVALSGSAWAEHGAVNEATLQEMGLSGIQLMSDDAALAIRGLGWEPMMRPRGHKKPWSMASGGSYASIDNKPDRRWEPDGEPLAGSSGGGGRGDWNIGAGSHDGFLAEGKYLAGGEHGSKAVRTKKRSYEVRLKGYPASKEIHTRSILIGAAGTASAWSL